MFKDIFLLEKDRTPLEAFGFYLCYLVLVVLTAGLLGFLIKPSSTPETFAEDFQLGLVIGQYFAVVACLALSFLVLYKKKRLNSFSLVLMAILSGILAVFLGGLLGLIPTAYLTTRKKD